MQRCATVGLEAQTSAPSSCHPGPAQSARISLLSTGIEVTSWLPSSPRLTLGPRPLLRLYGVSFVGTPSPPLWPRSPWVFRPSNLCVSSRSSFAPSYLFSPLHANHKMSYHCFCSSQDHALAQRRQHWLESQSLLLAATTVSDLALPKKRHELEYLISPCSAVVAQALWRLRS